MEIIAEIGSNWSMDYDILRMIDRCAEMGIRYAKLQLFQPIQVPLEYKNHVITYDIASTAFHYGAAQGVEVFFSVCYPEAIHLCETIGVKRYKIRFQDRFHNKIRVLIAQTEKPCIISIDNEYKWETYDWDRLLCVPKYPAEVSDYYGVFDKFSGFSDHTPDFQLFEIARDYHFKFHEMHMCLDDNCLERKWSKTFDELEDIL